MSWRVLLLAAALALLAAVGPSALVEPAFACLYDDPALCDGAPAPAASPAPAHAPSDPTDDPAVLVPALDERDEPLTLVEDEARCVVASLPGEEAGEETAEESTREEVETTGEGCEEATPAGSRCVEVERSFRVKSGLFGLFTLYRFHVRKHFCYTGRWIYEVFGTEWTTDRMYTIFTHVYERAHGHIGSFFTWNGNSHGGHWSLHWAKLDGCVLRWGCLNDYNPRMEMRNYANGETTTRIINAY
jgi:hypothetical protein